MPYKKYLQSINEMNQLTSNSSQDEIQRYSESDIYWARNRQNSNHRINLKKGDICQFEFGKNYIPEMSYEHRGLVIGIAKKLLYVLPICSFNPINEGHKKAYHPVDNPRDSDFYLLKGSDFSFLNHDSVLKLNDLRTVSINRSKYLQGNLPITSSTFLEIERKAFAKCFPTYSYDFDKLNEQKNQLEEEIIHLKKEYDDLIKELQEYKMAFEQPAIEEEKTHNKY